ncbi:HAMP domain-containing sensor histidine kinase [Niameybacter massiliensis]|uniref:HAMP domain-containing sensor histidine kinase n=1 Tax=Niameybacter massiliensis TaxID=1658108 RepID=UPI0006B57B19|nr:HAMP domain-containing sensor histidine kinase [Niameybacter massiliensis]
MKNKIIGPVMVAIWVLALIYMSSSYLSYEELSIRGLLEKNVAVHLGTQMIYKTVGITVIASIILYWILRTFIKEIVDPMQNMTEEASSFAKGEYVHQVKNYSIKEVQQLASALDDMGEKLYRTIRKLQYQKTKAESILSNLNEAIIILDEEGYITEGNEKVRTLLGGDAIKNQSILALIRDAKVMQVIEKAVGQGVYGSCEFLKNDQILHFRIGPISKGRKKYGFIISIRDITQTRQLEVMRYQFVSNVSHELKTPLTSIQGFAETLKEGAIDNRDIALRFIDIIDIEAKRLYRLIQDILCLSEIENMENNDGSEVNFTPLIEEVVSMLEQNATEKQVEIKLDIKQPLILECANTDYVKQVIMNIVSNAVKYTDEGNVIISTYIEDGKKVFCVQDTGIGIPEESLPRIFERFYRVDKSRSRKSGGTGLGLSIVKHIVELYGGVVEITSKVNQGTSFKIVFPE